MLTGKCPSCSDKLPLSFMARVQCAACGKYAKPNARQVNTYSVMFTLVSILAFLVDWRLALLLAVAAIPVLASRIEYVEVDD